MKELKIEIRVDECMYDELTTAERELIDASIEALDRSYANYSHFNVGAAIRLENGHIVQGANQENAAFPVTICAERTAIFAAQVSAPDQAITMIAISARNSDGLLHEPITPCGSCRQVMLEMEDRYKKDMAVLLYGKDKIYRLKTAKDLMPLCFVEENMWK